MSLLLTGLAVAGGAALAGKIGEGLRSRRKAYKDAIGGAREQDEKDRRELSGIDSQQKQFLGFNEADTQKYMSTLNQGAGAQIQAQQSALAQSGAAGEATGQLAQQQRQIGDQMGQAQAANSATIMNASVSQDAARKQQLAQDEMMLRGSLAQGLAREENLRLPALVRWKMAGSAVEAGGDVLGYLATQGAT